jgi:methionine-S-sulfoxide reductase
VCTDGTGDAEVVELTFDPPKVSYAALLTLFFELHDPTQVNRQVPDWGTQCRTVVFFHSPEQEAAAREAIALLDASHRYAKPIATRVVAANTFWHAEDYTRNTWRSAAPFPATSRSSAEVLFLQTQATPGQGTFDRAQTSRR